MSSTRAFAVVSLITSVALVTVAASLNNDSAIYQAFKVGANYQAVGYIGLALLLTAPACWPWLFAIRSANNPERRFSVLLFSTVVLGLAIASFSGIKNAPAEGLGWSAIVYYLVAWVTYPVSISFKL